MKNFPLPFFQLVKFSLVALGLTLFIFSPFIDFQDQLSTKVKSATFSRLTVPFSDNVPVASVSAQAVFIYDYQSGSLLYQKNADLKLHPASLTKMMTALIVLETYDLGQILTVNTAANSIGSSLHLLKGEKMTVEALLNASLISSSNDAAFTFAENDPSGYNHFLEKMNQKAREFNLLNSKFTNVTGVENQNHYSTARDLTTLAAKAIENPVFAKIVATKEAVITDVTSVNQYSLYNTNLLLGEGGVIGIKTGTTPLSGENLITLTSRNGHLIIITVLNSKDRFKDSQKLIDWTFEHHSWQEV